MSKKIQRNQMLAMLNAMDKADHEEKSLEIIRRLIASEEYKNAQIIGVTISRFPEIDTRPLIETAWKDGKKIAVPKCNNATREMDFRIIPNFDSLETVYMDLLEPIVEQTSSVSSEEIQLQIVPGVVFSNEGFRIGFGGGYYDRYLAMFTGGTVSLAFDCQTGQSVPVESHDIPVNNIITEQKLIQCTSDRFV